MGAEYRDKPSNSTAFRENSAQDVFLAWAADQEPDLDRGMGGSGQHRGQSHPAGRLPVHMGRDLMLR